jgi:hypothetical protein
VRRTAGAATMLPVGLLIGSIAAPMAAAKNGDTHITSVGSVQTIDCNNATLFVNGSANAIAAGRSPSRARATRIADNVANDITVDGFDQTALFKTGDPALIDRGRELGTTNRLDRVPA